MLDNRVFVGLAQQAGQRLYHLITPACRHHMLRCHAVEFRQRAQELGWLRLRVPVQACQAWKFIGVFVGVEEDKVIVLVRRHGRRDIERGIGHMGA